MNLLSAARSAGVGHFVYSSVHLADHPLAQKVGAFREKARFEKELLDAEDISSTILRPAIFMETLDIMTQGPVAFVPGRQRRPVSLIAARDIARAAVRAIQRDILVLRSSKAVYINAWPNRRRRKERDYAEAAMRSRTPQCRGGVQDPQTGSKPPCSRRLDRQSPHHLFELARVAHRQDR